MDLGWLDGNLVKAGLKWGFWPFVGICAVVWQVRSQFTKNRELKKEEHRDKMFLELHGEIDQLVREVSDLCGDANQKVFFLNLNVGWHTNPPEQTGYLPPIDFDPEAFMVLHEKFSSAVIRLILKLESLEIIHRNLFIFRRAFGSASYDLMQAYSALLPLTARFAKNEKGEPISGLEVTRHFHEVLEPKAIAYQDACGLVGNYIFDLGVEMQNFLLGSLFTHKVPVRDPVDPRFKVVKLEPDSYVEQLEAYFDNETPQGHANQRAEQDALAANAERLENE